MGKGVLAALPLAMFLMHQGIIMAAANADTMPWSYEGVTGPSHWGELSEDYIMCKQGKNQSPIDIVDATFDRLFTLEFEYKTVPLRLNKPQHTLEINYGVLSDRASANTVEIDGVTLPLPSLNSYNSQLVISGETYTLRSIGFRIPSEHSFENTHYAMEAQLLHKNKHNQYAVVSVLFEQGEENGFVEKLGEYNAEDRSTNIRINANELLPKDKGYYHYRGSLTTPPCTEGVRWFVLKEAVSISQEQLEPFSKAQKNYVRPKQPRNFRYLLESL